MLRQTQATLQQPHRVHASALQAGAGDGEAKRAKSCLLLISRADRAQRRLQEAGRSTHVKLHSASLVVLPLPLEAEHQSKVTPGGQEAASNSCHRNRYSKRQIVSVLVCVQSYDAEA